MAAVKGFAAVDVKYRIPDIKTDTRRGGAWKYWRGAGKKVPLTQYSEEDVSEQLAESFYEHYDCRTKECVHTPLVDDVQINGRYDDIDDVLERYGNLLTPHRQEILENLRTNGFADLVKEQRRLGGDLNTANTIAGVSGQQQKNKEGQESDDSGVITPENWEGSLQDVEDDDSDEDFYQSVVNPVKITGIYREPCKVGTPEYVTYKKYDRLHDKYYSNHVVRGTPGDNKVQPQDAKEKELGVPYYNCRLSLWQVMVIREFYSQGYEKVFYNNYEWEQKFLRATGIVEYNDDCRPTYIKECVGNWVSDSANTSEIESRYPGTFRNYQEIKKKRGKAVTGCQYKKFFYAMIGNAVKTPEQTKEIVLEHMRNSQNIDYWKKKGISQEYQRLFPRIISISECGFNTHRVSNAYKFDDKIMFFCTDYLTVREVRAWINTAEEGLFHKTMTMGNSWMLRIDWIPYEIQETKASLDVMRFFMVYEDSIYLQGNHPKEWKQITGYPIREDAYQTYAPNDWRLNGFEAIFNKEIRFDDVFDDYKFCHLCKMYMEAPFYHYQEVHHYTMHQHLCKECGKNFEHFGERCKKIKVISGECLDEKCEGYQDCIAHHLNDYDDEGYEPEGFISPDDYKPEEQSDLEEVKVQEYNPEDQSDNSGGYGTPEEYLKEVVIENTDFKEVVVDETSKPVIQTPEILEPKPQRTTSTTSDDTRMSRIKFFGNNRITQATIGNTGLILKKYRMDQKFDINEINISMVENSHFEGKMVYKGDDEKDTTDRLNQINFGAKILILEKHGLYGIDARSELGRRIVNLANETGRPIEFFYSACSACGELHIGNCICRCEQHDMEFNYYGIDGDMCKGCAKVALDEKFRDGTINEEEYEQYLIPVSTHRRNKCVACKRLVIEVKECNKFLYTRVPNLDEKKKVLEDMAAQNNLATGVVISYFDQIDLAFKNKDNEKIKSVVEQYKVSDVKSPNLSGKVHVYSHDLKQVQQFDYSTTTRGFHYDGNYFKMGDSIKQYKCFVHCKGEDIGFKQLYILKDRHCTVWFEDKQETFHVEEVLRKPLVREPISFIKENCKTYNEQVKTTLEQIKYHGQEWEDRPNIILAQEAREIVKNENNDTIKELEAYKIKLDEELMLKKQAQAILQKRLKDDKKLTWGHERPQKLSFSKLNEMYDDIVMPRDGSNRILETISSADEESVKSTSNLIKSESVKPFAQAINKAKEVVKDFKQTVKQLVQPKPEEIKYSKMEQKSYASVVKPQNTETIRDNKCLLKALCKAIGGKESLQLTKLIEFLESVDGKKHLEIEGFDSKDVKEELTAIKEGKYLGLCSVAALCKINKVAIIITHPFKSTVSPQTTVDFNKYKTKIVISTNLGELGEYEMTHFDYCPGRIINYDNLITFNYLSMNDTKTEKSAELDKVESQVSTATSSIRSSEPQAEYLKLSGKQKDPARKDKITMLTNKMDRIRTAENMVGAIMALHEYQLSKGEQPERWKNALAMLLELEMDKKMELSKEHQILAARNECNKAAKIDDTKLTSSEEFTLQYRNVFDNVKYYCWPSTYDVDDFKLDKDKLTPYCAVRREIFEMFALNERLWGVFLHNIHRCYITNTISSVYEVAKNLGLLAPIIDAFHHIEVFERVRSYMFTQFGVTIPVIQKKKLSKYTIHDVDKFNPFSCCALAEKFGNTVGGYHTFEERGDTSDNVFSNKYLLRHVEENKHHENCNSHREDDSIMDKELWLLEAFADKSARYSQKDLNNQVGPKMFTFDIAKYWKSKDEYAKKRYYELQDMFIHGRYMPPEEESERSYNNSHFNIDYIKRWCVKEFTNGTLDRDMARRFKEHITANGGTYKSSKFGKGIKAAREALTEKETGRELTIENVAQIEERPMIEKLDKIKIYSNSMEKCKFYGHGLKTAEHIRMHNIGDMNGSSIAWSERLNVLWEFLTETVDKIVTFGYMMDQVEIYDLCQEINESDENVITALEELNMHDIFEFITLTYRVTPNIKNEDVFSLMIENEKYRVAKNHMYDGAKYSDVGGPCVYLHDRFKLYNTTHNWKNNEKYCNTEKYWKAMQGFNDYFFCGFCKIEEQEYKDEINKMSQLMDAVQLFTLKQIPLLTSSYTTDNSHSKLGHVMTPLLYNGHMINTNKLYYCKSVRKNVYQVRITDTCGYDVYKFLLRFLEGRAASETHGTFTQLDHGRQSMIHLNKPTITFDNVIENTKCRYSYENTVTLGYIWMIDITDSYWIQMNSDNTQFRSDINQTWEAMLEQLGDNILGYVTDLMIEVKRDYPDKVPLIWIAYLVHNKMDLKSVITMYRNRYYSKASDDDSRWRFGSEMTRFKFTPDMQGDIDLTNIAEETLITYMMTGYYIKQNGNIDTKLPTVKDVVYCADGRELLNIGTKVKAKMINLQSDSTCEEKRIYVENLDNVYITSKAIIDLELGDLIKTMAKITNVHVYITNYSFDLVNDEMNLYDTEKYNKLDFEEPTEIGRNSEGEFIGTTVKTYKIVMRDGNTEELQKLKNKCEWAFVFPVAMKVTSSLKRIYPKAIVTNAGIFGTGPMPLDAIVCGDPTEMVGQKSLRSNRVCAAIKCEIAWAYKRQDRHVPTFGLYRFTKTTAGLLAWHHNEDYAKMSILPYQDSKNFKQTYKAFQHFYPEIRKIEDVGGAIEFNYHSNIGNNKLTIEKVDEHKLVWLAFNGVSEVTMSNEIRVPEDEYLRTRWDNLTPILKVRNIIAEKALKIPDFGLNVNKLIYMVTGIMLLLIPTIAILVDYFIVNKNGARYDTISTGTTRKILSDGKDNFLRLGVNTNQEMLMYVLYSIVNMGMNIVTIQILKMAKKPVVILWVMIVFNLTTNGLLCFTHIDYIHGIAILLKMVEMLIVGSFADPFVLMLLGMQWVAVGIMNYKFLDVEIYFDWLLIVIGGGVTITSSIVFAIQKVRDAKFVKKNYKDQDGRKIKEKITYRDLDLDNHMKHGPLNTPYALRPTQALTEPTNGLMTDLQNGKVTTIADFVTRNEFLQNPNKTMLHNLALKTKAVSPDFSLKMLKYTGVVRNKHNSFLGHFFVAGGKIHFNTHFLEHESTNLETKNRREIIKTLKFYLPLEDKYIQIADQFDIESYSDWTMIESPIEGGTLRPVKTQDGENLVIILWMQQNGEVVPKTISCEGKAGMAHIVSYAGFCGAPYISTDGKVIGMHYAGSPHTPTNYKMEWEDVQKVKNSQIVDKDTQDKIIGVHRLTWVNPNKNQLQGIKSEEIFVDNIIEAQFTHIDAKRYDQVPPDDTFRPRTNIIETRNKDIDLINEKEKEAPQKSDALYGGLNTYSHYKGEYKEFTKPVMCDMVQQNILAAQLDMAKKIIREVYPEHDKVTHERIFYACMQIAGIVFPKYGTKVYSMMHNIIASPPSDWDNVTMELNSELKGKCLITSENDEVLLMFMNVVFYQIMVSRYYTNLTPEYAIWYLWAKGYDLNKIRKVMKNFTGEWNFLKEYGYDYTDVKKQWVDEFGSPLPQSVINRTVKESELREFLYGIVNEMKFRTGVITQFKNWWSSIGVTNIEYDSSLKQKQKLEYFIYKFVERIIDTDTKDVESFFNNLVDKMVNYKTGSEHHVIRVIKNGMSYNEIKEICDVMYQIGEKNNVDIELTVAKVLTESYRRWVVVKSLNGAIKNRWIRSINATPEMQRIRGVVDKLDTENAHEIGEMLGSMKECNNINNNIKDTLRRYVEPFSNLLPEAAMSNPEQGSGDVRRNWSDLQVRPLRNKNKQQDEIEPGNGRSSNKNDLWDSKDLIKIMNHLNEIFKNATNEQRYENIDDYERWKRTKYGKYCVDFMSYVNLGWFTYDGMVDLIKICIKEKLDYTKLPTPSDFVKWIDDNYVHHRNYNNPTEMAKLLLPPMTGAMLKFHTKEETKRIAVDTRSKKKGGRKYTQTDWVRELDNTDYNVEYTDAKNLRSRRGKGGKQAYDQGVENLITAVDNYEMMVQELENENSKNYLHMTLKELEGLQARLEVTIERAEKMPQVTVGKILNDMKMELSRINSSMKKIRHEIKSSQDKITRETEKMNRDFITSTVNGVLGETMDKECVKNSKNLSGRLGLLGSGLSSISQPRKWLDYAPKRVSPVVDDNLQH